MGDRQALRDVLQDPGEQRGQIGRHAGRRRKRSGIVGGYAIEDRQAGLDRSCMAGIDAPLDRGGEDHAPTFLETEEGVAPGWMIEATTPYLRPSMVSWCVMPCNACLVAV